MNCETVYSRGLPPFVFPKAESISGGSPARFSASTHVSMKALVVDSKIIDLFPHFEIEREIFAEAGIADSIISNRRVLFHTDQGYPDGMTIDTEDMIWAAVWGSGCVFRIDPHSGRIVNTVETGAPNVTSVAIANRKLYITSAARGMSEAELSEYPQSGSLFVAPVETEGASLFRYVGRHEIYK